MISNHQNPVIILKLSVSITNCYGPGSSVVTATYYWLDGPESNPGSEEIFRPFRSVLGPTQPPVKLVSGLS